MTLTAADLEAIRALVRDELERLRPKRKRRRGACGTASRPPECESSAVYGSEWCTCRRSE